MRYFDGPGELDRPRAANPAAAAREVEIGKGPYDRRAWVRVARGLLARIESGELKPGDPVPSLRPLAAQAGVSVGTAATAILRLAAEGVLQQPHGRVGMPRCGYLVRDDVTVEDGTVRARPGNAMPGGGGSR